MYAKIARSGSRISFGKRKVHRNEVGRKRKRERERERERERAREMRGGEGRK